MTESDRKKRVIRTMRGSPRPPLMLNGDIRFMREVEISVKDLPSLRIDESYQRMEISGWVNELIRVLEFGGKILDLITVAVRADGNRYIVDGQQRYWAHWNCQRPIRARLYSVANADAERTLFLAHNRHSIYVRSIGLACHAHWYGLKTSDAWPTPRSGVVSRLQQFKWERYAPDQQQRWLGIISEEILRRWPAKGGQAGAA